MITVIQKPVADGNWRRGTTIPRTVNAVVLHIIEGGQAAADSWFNNPAAVVSAHFAVARDGRIHQYVGIHDIAYHAGWVRNPTWNLIENNPTPNSTTVGIEHEGTGVESWTASQVLSSAILSAWLAERFSLTASPECFPLHREIFSGKSCPGPTFNRAHYLDAVASVRRLFGPATKSLIHGIR